jgi:hypothetical protein
MSRARITARYPAQTLKATLASAAYILDHDQNCAAVTIKPAGRSNAAGAPLFVLIKAERTVEPNCDYSTEQYRRDNP